MILKHCAIADTGDFDDKERTEGVALNALGPSVASFVLTTKRLSDARPECWSECCSDASPTLLKDLTQTTMKKPRDQDGIYFGVRLSWSVNRQVDVWLASTLSLALVPRRALAASSAKSVEKALPRKGGLRRRDVVSRRRGVDVWVKRRDRRPHGCGGFFCSLPSSSFLFFLLSFAQRCAQRESRSMHFDVQRSQGSLPFAAFIVRRHGA